MASRYRLCPQCVENENDTNGFAYWHRSHQLCGVSVCHIHGCDLIAKCRSCGDPVRTPRHLDLPAYICKSCGTRHMASFSYPSGVRRLADLANESLSKTLSPQNPFFVAAAFQQRLKELMVVGWHADFMLDEYSRKYVEAECSGRFKSGAIDFLKHFAREKDPLYIYEVGSFARFSDLLVSVDMLFGSWQMLDLAIAQCQIDPPEGIQNAFPYWRTPREKSRLLGCNSEQFGSAIPPTINLPHHVDTPLEYA